MTPTLTGRWQTRALTLLVFGSIVSTILVVQQGESQYYRVLAYVALFGVGWDVLYTLLQRLRWDRDWPTSFAIASAGVEALVLFYAGDHFGLPGVAARSLSIAKFTAHFGGIWLLSFLWVQGPARVFFPYWRFHGSRITPVVALSQQQRRAV